MEEEDGEISLDIAADLPDEAAALEAAMRGVLRGIQDAEAPMKVANLKQIENLTTRFARFDARQQRLPQVACCSLRMDAMGWRSKEWARSEPVILKRRDSFGADHRRRPRTLPAVSRSR